MGDDSTIRSVAQRVTNAAKLRGLSRSDAFTTYAMDRLLFRLGRSSQRSEFFLKGGVLVANLVDNPFRFTRDIDLLRRHGPPALHDMRERFRAIAALDVGDGLQFGPVRALPAEHDEDGYDGVRLRILVGLGGLKADLKVDIGFGDAHEPTPVARPLTPFLADDLPARVLVYSAEQVIAEKVQTLLWKYPDVRHRLKDLLDIAMLAQTTTLSAASLLASLTATMDRRGTPLTEAMLDTLRTALAGRRWQRDWAVMLKDKAVAAPIDLRHAVELFDAFVRPLIVAPESIEHWTPPGPWQYS